MKLFIFNCNNYYRKRKSYFILAETSKEAEDILYKENDAYIKDEETYIESVEVIGLDKARFLIRI